MDQIEAKEVIYERNYVTAQYNSQHELITVKWNGNVDRDQYKEFFGCLLAHAEKHKVSRFLSDVTNQGVVAIESRKYFETVVSPRAVELGLKKTAVITDANAFKRYYLNMIIKATAKFGNKVELFNSYDKGLSYLLND